MYVIVTDDNLAAEPEPGSLRCKSSRRGQQQIRAGRRSSVSAERYDPERDLAAADSAGVGGDEATSSAVVVPPKTPEQRQRLTDAVRDILLFRSQQIREHDFFVIIIVVTIFYVFNDSIFQYYFCLKMLTRMLSETL